jgi:nucleotide-binding universal stress UspA family protein
MKPERILLPIEVTRCPLEVFAVVNGFARRPEVTVILLSVVNLNITAPESRVYGELSEEAHWHLRRLARDYVHPVASTVTRVRAGSAAEEILAAAQAESVDLIILPTYGPSFWGRVLGIWKPVSSPVVCRLTERVVREAPCGVFVVYSKTAFNCEKAWGRPANTGGQAGRERAESVGTRTLQPATW